MARLLDDLFDVSRITHNKLELRSERLELATVIQSAVETSRPHFDKDRNDLTIHLMPEPIYVNADSVRLAQVFTNLLNNASKYSGPGGHIHLRCERQGSDAVVTVSDDGRGIAAAMVPHIFDAFTQGTSVAERPQEGLGIGLSLVRGLVHLHGGTVEAHSDGPGRGSQFVVRLPAVLVQPVPRVHPSPGAAPPAGPKRRLLIADDLQDSADSLALLLRTQGHEVWTAYDGQAALIAAEQFKPDIVLLDIGMPKLNGYDTCRLIRQHEWGKGMWVVALTGWGQQDDRQRARDAGFDHHMLKPVDPDELRKLLSGPTNS